MRRTHPPSVMIIGTKFIWLRVTVKQTRPLYRFSNRFYVRLNLKVCEFRGNFGGFFNYAHLPPMGDAPILSQVKGLMEIHNRGNFNEYTICGCEVMNLQIFSDQQKISFLGAFGWFFGHNSRECSQILFKFETIMKTNILHHIYHGF